MSKRHLLDIGPIIEGRPTHLSDILSRLLAQCKSIQLREEEWKTACYIGGTYLTDHDALRRHMFEAEATEAEIEAEVDRVIQDHIEKMIEILNAHAPDFCYFGWRHGDREELGCWPDDGVPFHGSETDEIGKGNDLPPASATKQGHYLVVNDHGNCKVKSGRTGQRWIICWSLV
jgi:hypothetical protein